MKTLKIVLQFNYIYLIITVLIAIYAFIFTQVIKHNSIYEANTTIISGTITQYHIDGNKLSLEIKAEENIKATYYINSEDEKELLQDQLCLGCQIKLEGTLNKPLKNTIPNTFNYQNYLSNNGIYWTFSIDSYELSRDNNFLYKIKDYLYHRVELFENKDYFLVFILGDKSLLESEEYNKFQSNGISHLLAISGMHIGVIIGILNKLLVNISPFKKHLIILLILFFLAFLTNFPASILRAIFFYAAISIKKIFNLKIHNFKLLLIIAYLLIILNPFIIYDIGFIYSFIITGGIILNNEFIRGRYISSLFKLSLITFLYSIPITIYLNYEINLLSIFFNMIIIPYVSSILYPMLLLTFIFPFLEIITNILINILVFLNNLFYTCSLNIIFPKPNFLFISIYYIILIFPRKPKNIYILVILLLLLKTSPKLNSHYEIYYLDVGQGDSSILISPHQKEVIMIDTGGKIAYEKEPWQETIKTYDLIDNTIKFLKSKGITKIDTFIISHGDYDHMGEALNLIDKFKVEEVIFNNNEYNDLELALIEVLEEKNISYHKDITELDFANNKLYFLNHNLYDNENDNSNVVYTEFDGIKLLFTGDAGVEVEADILEKHNLQNIDILKVGHHGSKTGTSKDFINEINPKYSIISVGKNNRYGHPNNDVLENLAETTIYRTDLNGSVMFKIKNNKLEINTYPP